MNFGWCKQIDQATWSQVLACVWYMIKFVRYPFMKGSHAEYERRYFDNPTSSLSATLLSGVPVLDKKPFASFSKLPTVWRI